MATPGELSKITAKVLGLPEAQVHSAYRVLREAGLVTKGGRGPAAAKMTARDAAMLLAAILGSSQIIESATAARRYSKTKPVIHEYTGTLHRNVAIPALAALPDAHSFVDALTALISAAADGKLLQGLWREYVWNGVMVTVQNPSTVADIEIRGPKRGTSASVKYTGPSDTARLNGDLEEYRRCKTKTFLYIGALLAGALNELPPLDGSGQ